MQSAFQMGDDTLKGELRRHWQHFECIRREGGLPRGRGGLGLPKQSDFTALKAEYLRRFSKEWKPSELATDTNKGG